MERIGIKHPVGGDDIWLAAMPSHRAGYVVAIHPQAVGVVQVVIMTL